MYVSHPGLFPLLCSHLFIGMNAWHLLPQTWPLPKLQSWLPLPSLPGSVLIQKAGTQSRFLFLTHPRVHRVTQPVIASSCCCCCHADWCSSPLTRSVPRASFLPDPSVLLHSSPPLMLGLSGLSNTQFCLCHSLLWNLPFCHGLRQPQMPWQPLSPSPSLASLPPLPLHS